MSPQHVQVLLQLLQLHTPQAQVWAYGSRVTGVCHEGSDVDLVLRQPDQPDADMTGWIELKEALQQSALPMLVDVHLWSHLPAAFQANIKADYIQLQPK